MVIRDTSREVATSPPDTQLVTDPRRPSVVHHGRVIRDFVIGVGATVCVHIFAVKKRAVVETLQGRVKYRGGSACSLITRCMRFAQSRLSVLNF